MRVAKEKADERITQARELGRRAREARTNIVRRVFNDSLNAVWRDLFLRLAPDEPFVPAFALPEAQSAPVEAVLETLYRAGGKGGNPRAMLSAGNLNTAALTLFLALHLSVGPMLPWLVIDDPVQSMDEVHIAQFAALLRTLATQHGRQIIIAVHEKPLFDYLTLELSPAFRDNRLITIEMGRTASGGTVVKVGGENVDPMETEGLLLEHPAVQQVAVVGLPDERLGEVAVAYVECRAGATIDAEEVVDHCRGKIASFKLPRHVVFIDVFPMTKSGKIRKAALREDARKQFGVSG